MLEAHRSYGSALMMESLDALAALAVLKPVSRGLQLPWGNPTFASLGGAIAAGVEPSS